MDKTIGIVVVLLAIAISAYGAVKWRGVEVPEQVFCTMEAKLCPDGSYVGRTGPKCEFTACPGSISTPQGIAPYHSGVRGTVKEGLTPLATLVAVFRASDLVHAVALGESSADGIFSFDLPPGDYVVGAGESNQPQCSHESVTVLPQGYSSILVSCQ